MENKNRLENIYEKRKFMIMEKALELFLTPIQIVALESVWAILFCRQWDNQKQWRGREVDVCREDIETNSNK